jgi:replicative DNA helicase
MVPSAANIRRYADAIIERAKSRQLLAVAAEIHEVATEHGRSIEDRVEASQAQLAKLLDDAPRDEWISAHEGMTLHTQILEDRAAGHSTAMPTGLVDLDEFLEGGIRPGELVIVGARPSMGKTALAMSIGVNMAQDYSVAMLSMEMPHNEVRDRLTAMLGRVSLSAVKRPSRGNGLDWGRVMDGIDRAKDLNFYVSDQGGLTINQVRGKARNIKRMHGLNVLLVDYIGLMNGLDGKQPRAYQLEEISRGLKTLAKELGIGIVCLAQVNRKVEERADHTPNLSDLRDSGAIEQDADVVIFVHRPIQSRPEMGMEWTHYAKASVQKNRNGRCGVLNLHYQGDQTLFTSWAGEAPTRATSFASKGRDL